MIELYAIELPFLGVQSNFNIKLQIHIEITNLLSDIIPPTQLEFLKLIQLACVTWKAMWLMQGSGTLAASKNVSTSTDISHCGLGHKHT